MKVLGILLGFSLMTLSCNSEYSALNNTGEEQLQDTNFINFTGEIGLVPYNDNFPESSWEYIYQEKESGMMVTNLLGFRQGEEAKQLCQSLNGGTAGNGWILPSISKMKYLREKNIVAVKELGDLSKFFWSATSARTIKPRAYVLDFSDQSSKLYYLHTSNHRAVICVRI